MQERPYYSRSQVRPQVCLAAAFLVVMLDSLLNYFLDTFAVRVPINLIVPLLLLCSVLRVGLAGVAPPRGYFAILLLFVAANGLAVVTAEGVPVRRLLEVLSAAAAFVAGFAFFRNTTDENLVGRLFGVVAWLYVLTCIIALAGVLPDVFPKRSGLWLFDGQLVERPEVTTDQNFQIFYLMPIIPLLALPFRPVRFGLAIGGVLGGLFVLAQLQTRSGLLVYIGLVVMTCLLPLRNRSLGRAKVLPMFLFLTSLLLISLPFVYKYGQDIVNRFLHTDYVTARDRLNASLYLFEKLLDLDYWLPAGNQEFVHRTGNVPHSNMTAAFLEGGIAGLMCWVFLIASPLLRICHRFWQMKLDAVGCLVLVMGVGMFVIQLSLNVPFVDQVWLWAGAVVGTLVRLPNEESRFPTVAGRLPARKV